MTVSPAYGRDYTSLKAARADWKANRDFIIRSIVHGPGRYINKQDWERERKAGQHFVVSCRFNKEADIGVIAE